MVPFYFGLLLLTAHQCNICQDCHAMTQSNLGLNLHLKKISKIKIGPTNGVNYFGGASNFAEP